MNESDELRNGHDPQADVFHVRCKCMCCWSLKTGKKSGSEIQSVVFEPFRDGSL